MASWPTWVVVLLCSAFAQVLKLLAYSLTRRAFLPAALFQGSGLPSLPAVATSCLLILVSMRSGWMSSEAAFALVFAVIVVHDTVKLSGLAGRQRQVMTLVLESFDPVGGTRGRVADFLDPRVHHPAHVFVGVVLGALFALAFGTAPR